MKSRWLLITLLLAFPVAFAFFLTEARLGQQRTARRVLVIPPTTTSTQAPAASDIGPMGPMSPIRPISETAKPTAPSSDEQVVELANGGFTVPTRPTLLSGSFTKEDNSLVYDSDAKLRLATDDVLSSPTGVMVSNEKQTIFAGDMQIEAGKTTITAHEGVLDTTTNQMTATVASWTVINDKNEKIRMTGSDVTIDFINPTQTFAAKKPADDSTTKNQPTSVASVPRTTNILEITPVTGSDAVTGPVEDLTDRTVEEIIEKIMKDLNVKKGDPLILIQQTNTTPQTPPPPPSPAPTP